MHCVCLVVFTAAIISGSEIYSPFTKRNFTYFIQNITHSQLEPIFDQIFKWNASVKDPLVTSTDSTSHIAGSPESTETTQSWTENNKNKTDSGESWSSSTEHFAWWVPPSTPWWTPEPQEPTETTTSGTPRYDTTTSQWQTVTQTTSWWTPNPTESSTAHQSTWWSPVTDDTSWWDGSWTDDSFWETSSSNPLVSTESTTLKRPLNVGTSTGWTPKLTEAPTETTTAMFSWWVPSYTEDGFWSEENSTSFNTNPPTTSKLTTVWPPSVGTAPWWTPNLTESTQQQLTTMEESTTVGTETTILLEKTSTTTAVELLEVTTHAVPLTSSVSPPSVETPTTSELTTVWPPSVGTAPWWTPNLTESTQQQTTVEESTTVGMETTITSENTSTTTPVELLEVTTDALALTSSSTSAETETTTHGLKATTPILFNVTEAAPPAPHDPTGVIGYDVPCGVRHGRSNEGKIVGGYTTAPGEIPWQVSLQVFTGYGYGTRHICGGSIISRYFVVTAGHCVHGSNSNVFSVVGGDYNLFDIEGHEQRRRVEKIYTDFYEKSVYKNDIALLELTRPFKFDDFISPICLPDPGLLVSNHEGLLSGWGRLSEGGALPHILQAVEAPIPSDSLCNQTYEAAGYGKYMNPCHVCTGSKQGGIDTCQGDSGGPLACELPDGRYYLCGITSWGVGCARPDFYGVYTRVSCFSEWVKGILYAKELAGGEPIIHANFTTPAIEATNESVDIDLNYSQVTLELI